MKFLTEEGVACEIEDDPWYNIEILNCAATVSKTVLGEGGGGEGRPIPIVLGNFLATFGVWSNFLRF